jgi:uncharacterized protein
MPTMPKSLFWVRTDTAGSDHALLDDRGGFRARGVAQAVDPVGFTCNYELIADETWHTARLEVTAEGAGWLRTLRLERAAGRWRATTGEQGDLDGALRRAGHAGAGLPGIEDPYRLEPALDVDLSAGVLFNVLPVRRLGLHRAGPGTSHRITVAWVLAPSLEVIPADQVYTALGDNSVRFETDGFGADIELDADGYVVRYPGLAERADAQR